MQILQKISLSLGSYNYVKLMEMNLFHAYKSGNFCLKRFTQEISFLFIWNIESIHNTD